MARQNKMKKARYKKGLIILTTVAILLLIPITLLWIKMNDGVVIDTPTAIPNEKEQRIRDSLSQ